MSIAHTWRAAKPDQWCQECRTHAKQAGDAWTWARAVWALAIEGSKSGEELLCADCATFIARSYGLSDPNNSQNPNGCASSPPASEASARHAGAEANPSPEVKTVLTSTQTSEAADVSPSAASEPIHASVEQ